MNIAEQKFVSLSYTLTSGGETVESVPADKPLSFVYGIGQLLPKFEQHLAGLKTGDKFQFTLTPADGYGELNPEAVVELPKDIFMIDGVLAEEMLTVGNVLPMSDQAGNRLMGTIRAIGDASVTMDFNHPMAGKTLEFSGEVVGVRDSTPEDLMPMMGGGCGCGCDDGCEDDCEKSGCGGCGC